MLTEAFTLITVASWEERFLLGFERLLEATRFDQAIILHSKDYSHWTEHARSKAALTCEERGVKHLPGVIYNDNPSATWTSTLAKTLGELPEYSSAVVDISTMPREIIWQTFWFLQLRKCQVHYVYNRPTAYGDWLSRDPDQPRLVYKLSGISKIGARTLLVVLAGYDIDRVRHLISVFEPSITLLGLQQNSVDHLNGARMEALAEAFRTDGTVVQFTLDAFSDDHGKNDISVALLPYLSSHNIIMASMGPKLSAVALYLLHAEKDSLGLVYLPSREFNRDYSSGIGESIYGNLDVE